MAKFADYVDLVPPIRLPYGGREYELPVVGMQDAEIIDRAATEDEEGVEIDKPSDAEVERILLGEAGVQMRANNVPFSFQARAVKTAMADYRFGRTTAEAVWATNGRPDLMEKWLAEQVLEQASPDPVTTSTATSPAEDQTTT